VTSLRCHDDCDFCCDFYSDYEHENGSENESERVTEVVPDCLRELDWHHLQVSHVPHSWVYWQLSALDSLDDLKTV
jgi:hypothetical protein